MELVYEHAIDDKEVKGKVKLTCPTTPERLELISTVGLQFDDKGNVDTKDVSKMLPAIAKIAERMKHHYKEVDLKLEDGTEIKTYEEFAAYPECQNAFMQTSMLFASGFRPSKKQKPS